MLSCSRRVVLGRARAARGYAVSGSGTLNAVLSARRTHSSVSRLKPVYVLPVDPIAPATVTQSVDTAQLWSTVPSGPKPPKKGTTHVFYGEDHVAVLSSLGDKFASMGQQTKPKGEKREVVRSAVGSAVKRVRNELGESLKGSEVLIDGSLDPHAAAVGAHLALYKFTLKTKPEPSPFDPRKAAEKVPEKLVLKPLQESKEWDAGREYAEAQNFARTLMEMPGNLMTPTLFAERVQAEFSSVPHTKVIVHDKDWAAEKGMNTFLSVAKGTSEPPKFLEIHYTPNPESTAPPLVYVGKGVTFDSGGISIKPSAGMKLMRGDMGGAASVCAAALGIAKLGLPVNMVVLTPLTENMPGPSANKPGDIVYAMNGKSVEIDNTDAEGRLILADALYYATTAFKPQTVLDVATLTGAMDIALGDVFTGVFTNSDSLWQELEAAGEHEHDRFWRMPLSEDYSHQITGSNADLCNVGGRKAGSCTAALFLKSFVEGVEPSEGEDEPRVRWAHLDIAGTMEASKPGPYQDPGMTGRSTRALIEFAKRHAKA
ncbi:leucine aminopeptidase [Panus rudis PR-1116 ss-1]|nr:leucine aminopeptidase [Panus rudis PR-1116 ss-1]